MKKSGAQPGNNNASKGRPWTDALRRALKQMETAGFKRGEALNKIAETVVLAALAGEKEAIQEIANRLDGKPVQPSTISGDDGGPITVEIIRFSAQAPDPE